MPAPAPWSLQAWAHCLISSAVKGSRGCTVALPILPPGNVTPGADYEMDPFDAVATVARRPLQLIALARAFVLGQQFTRVR